jgi:hypothetical protein
VKLSEDDQTGSGDVLRGVNDVVETGLEKTGKRGSMFFEYDTFVSGFEESWRFVKRLYTFPHAINGNWLGLWTGNKLCPQKA